MSGNAAANCVGIVNDAEEFSLFLSEHILSNILKVLVKLSWAEPKAQEYAGLLVEIARASGGGIVEPAVSVNHSTDHEDNRILELALASGAMLLVSDDDGLVSLSTWRGTPIVRSSEFASRVEALRRVRRRMP